MAARVPVALLASVLALAAAAAPAAAAPAILTARTAGLDITQRLEERPATISVSEANERILAGSYLGFGTDPGPDFGPLTWTTYTETEATATGIAYVPRCTARTCLEVAFHPIPASVRAFAPRSGYFTRLAITYTFAGDTVVERTRVGRYPADGDGGRAHWGYVIELPGYDRCGSILMHRRQFRRRGRVMVNPDVATCKEARRVARRAATRVAEVGNPLPAPRGWACAGGFRPTVDNPRPTRIGCFRRGAAATFLRSFAPFYQVAVH
jgi:hypothetical protein